MSKENLQCRLAVLRKAKMAVGEQLDLIEAPRGAAIKSGLPLPSLTADQCERLNQLDEEDGRLCHAIWEMEDACLARPTRSRHDLVTKLEIIAGRAGLADDISEHVKRLLAQVMEWRRVEPIIWPCAGTANA
jgi:hypothetical protein